MAERRYFGTDGVRGRVGEMPITPELVMKLGFAAGKVLAAQDGHARGDRPGVLIGKDTRISGYLLEAALEAGLSAAGVDVYLCGPLPTPGIAHLTRALRLSAGIVISASHNPFDDNGIKFFGGTGAKLPDATEAAIERAMEGPIDCVPSAALGKARRVDDAAGRYIEFCKSTFPNELDLKGLSIVVDCAHGAAYHVAPTVFRELGAEVVPVAVEPDGVNINAGVGATVPAHLVGEVLAHHADLGIALDGDGDRLVMVDAHGRKFDGDELLYVIARDYQHRGTLAGGVVGTQMSNLGFEQALSRAGIELERARVGDRYVLELMRDRGWELGGENSGHIICLDKHTTGDGIISALQVLHAVRESGRSLAQLTSDLAMYPQVLVNVEVPRGFDWKKHPSIATAQASAERALAGKGRVLLRPSGTEPVLRVMVEGEPREAIESAANSIASAVKRAAAG
jgi:phosphoglucosamine mutase